MQEIVVDVREHAGACSEVVERSLQSLGVGTILRRSNSSVRCGNLEDDAGFLVCNRGLRCELIRQCIAPREVDSNLGES